MDFSSLVLLMFMIICGVKLGIDTYSQNNLLQFLGYQGNHCASLKRKIGEDSNILEKSSKVFNKST